MNGLGRTSDAERNEFIRKKNSAPPLWAQLFAGLIAICCVYGLTQCNRVVQDTLHETVRAPDSEAEKAGERAGRLAVGVVNYAPGSDRLASLAIHESRVTTYKGVDQSAWSKGFMRGYREEFSKR